MRLTPEATSPSLRVIVRSSFKASLIIAIALSCLGFTVAGGISLWSETRGLDRDMRHRLTRYTTGLVTAYTLKNTDGLEYQLGRFAEGLSVECLTLVTRDGARLTSPPNGACAHAEGLTGPLAVVSGGLAIGDLYYQRDHLVMMTRSFADKAFIFPILLLAIALTWIPLRRNISKFITDPIARLTHDLENPGPVAKTDYSSTEVNLLRDKIEQFHETRRKNIQLLAAGEISAQVAHDIRSPLAALDIAARELSQEPEEIRGIIKEALNRIKDISNNLLEKNKGLVRSRTSQPQGEREAPSVHLMSSLLETLVSEKRMRFRSMVGTRIDARFEPSSYGLFGVIEAVEFRRALSNLLDNAVEALVDEKGDVEVSLTERDGQIEILVRDSGRGIAPGILEKLGQRGFSHGKKDGSGLGVWHAIACVERWGGRLAFESREGVGTTVSIRLPKASPPRWFLPALELAHKSRIVVLDDDSSIHQVWQGRFSALKTSRTIHHFTNTADAREWFRAQGPNAPRDTLFLCDYELIGRHETGLDMIEDLGIAADSVLVTARFEEPRIRERCDRLGVGLVPKGLAGFVPIQGEA